MVNPCFENSTSRAVNCKNNPTHINENIELKGCFLIKIVEQRSIRSELNMCIIFNLSIYTFISLYTIKFELQGMYVPEEKQ